MVFKRIKDAVASLISPAAGRRGTRASPAPEEEPQAKKRKVAPVPKKASPAKKAPAKKASPAKKAPAKKATAPKAAPAPPAKRATRGNPVAEEAPPAKKAA